MSTSLLIFFPFHRRRCRTLIYYSEVPYYAKIHFASVSEQSSARNEKSFSLVSLIIFCLLLFKFSESVYAVLCCHKGSTNTPLFSLVNYNAQSGVAQPSQIGCNMKINRQIGLITVLQLCLFFFSN